VKLDEKEISILDDFTLFDIKLKISPVPVDRF
jgi:hypothetical protein